MSGRIASAARLVAAGGAVVVAIALALPAVASAQSISMDELRAKLKEGKKKIVAANMTLTPTEETAFWPIYDEYQTKLEAINQSYGKVINSYAEAWNAGPVGDAAAKSILDDAMKIQEQRLKLKQDAKKKLLKALPPAKAMRYLQIENKIEAVVDYEVADAVPLAE